MFILAFLSFPHFRDLHHSHISAVDKNHYHTIIFRSATGWILVMLVTIQHSLVFMLSYHGLTKNTQNKNVTIKMKNNCECVNPLAPTHRGDFFDAKSVELPLTTYKNVSIVT